MLDRERLLQLARTYWWALAVGVFLLVYAGMGFVIVSAGQSKEAKTALLARQQAIVRSAAGRAQEVEAQYKTLQGNIPSAGLQEIDVYRYMLDLATRAPFELDEKDVTIAFSGEARQQIGKEQYRALSFLLTVKGDQDKVLALVQRLDQGMTRYQTLVLDKTSLRFGEEGNNAAMNFIIFTRLTGQ